MSLLGGGVLSVTDAQGHFTIENAPVGRNTLLFQGEGNSRGSLAVDLHEGRELHLAVELGAEDVNLVCETEEPEGSNNDGDHPSGSANACDEGDQNDGPEDDGQHEDDHEDSDQEGDTGDSGNGNGSGS